MSVYVHNREVLVERGVIIGATSGSLLIDTCTCSMIRDMSFPMIKSRLVSFLFPILSKIGCVPIPCMFVVLVLLVILFSTCTLCFMFCFCYATPVRRWC